MMSDVSVRALAAAASVLERFRLAWLSLVFVFIASSAWADLVVYPTRIVFDGNTRAAQLDLVNNGRESASYRIHLVNKRMTETGNFVDVTAPAPGEGFAEGMIRYSPRQVTLAPGASQTIRLSVRKPADLPEGEYRSHLHFERVPDAGTSGGSTAATAGELGVQLRLLVGVTIPVIVRHGNTTASVRLTDLRFTPPAGGGPAALSFVLNRTGNRSVYGDLGATFIPQGGAELQVGKASGVAVYTPNPLRRGTLELRPPAGIPLSRGTLRLTYRERPEEGGKLLAEAVLALP